MNAEHKPKPSEVTQALKTVTMNEFDSDNPNTADMEALLQSEVDRLTDAIEVIHRTLGDLEQARSVAQAGVKMIEGLKK